MFSNRSVPSAILAIYDSVAEPEAWDSLLDELAGDGIPRRLFEGDEFPPDEHFEKLPLGESARVFRVLLPHIRRAWSLRKQLVVGEQTRDIFCDALSPADFGILVVDADLAVRWASAGVEARYRRYGLHFREPGSELPTVLEHEELQAALVAVLDNGVEEALVRVPAVSSDGPRFLEIRVTSTVPGDGAVPSVFPERKGATLLSSEVGAPIEQFARRLQEVHGLTPAEARIASLAFEGRSPKEIAAMAGCSYHTTRTHLRAIRAKTGTSSHAQLVALLHRGVAPLSSPVQE